MAAIFNMGGSLLRLYLFSVLVLLTTNGIAQKSGKTMKSTYKIISDEFSYVLPDTMFKKLGIDTGTLRVPLGNMYYTNYFQGGKSRTEIDFVPEPGIRVRGSTSSYLLFNQKDSSIQQYGDDTLVRSYRTFFPKLVKVAQQRKIGEYDCKLYSFTTDTSRIEFWFTKQLPYSVNPGIYYKDLGGLIRIDYNKGNELKSVQLESFEETNKKLGFNPIRTANLKQRKIHWIFN